MALDRRFGFAGAAAVLMLVQVQALALDRRFGFAGAGAGCRVMPGRDDIVPRMTSCHACHAGDDIMSW